MARPKTLSQRQLSSMRDLATEDDVAELDAWEVDRPKQPDDCRPCPRCQAWRDDLSDRGPTRILECGHSTHQALARSRPCIFASCAKHLLLDVNPENGSLRLTFPDANVYKMEKTCSLDVADEDGATLFRVGSLINLTRERIRQVEVKALRQLGYVAERYDLKDAESSFAHDVGGYEPPDPLSDDAE